MPNVISNRSTLSAGGGGYELPSLSIGIFLNDQPTHRFAHGTTRTELLPLESNQGWILPAGSNGACEFDDDLEFVLVSLNVQILAEFGMEANFDFQAIVGELDPLLLSLCLQAPEFSASGTLYRETMHRALAAQIIHMVKPIPDWHIGIEDARLRRVLDYIHDHLADDLSLADMAGIAAMSGTHFSKALGMSPLQYVIAARLDLASVLLKTTKLTVAEIAWRTGYQDLSRFGQHFKRKFGAPPAAFRA